MRFGYKVIYRGFVGALFLTGFILGSTSVASAQITGPETPLKQRVAKILITPIRAGFYSNLSYLGIECTAMNNGTLSQTLTLLTRDITASNVSPLVQRRVLTLQAGQTVSFAWLAANGQTNSAPKYVEFRGDPTSPELGTLHAQCIVNRAGDRPAGVRMYEHSAAMQTFPSPVF